MTEQQHHIERIRSWDLQDARDLEIMLRRYEADVPRDERTLDYSDLPTTPIPYDTTGVWARDMQGRILVGEGSEWQVIPEAEWRAAQATR